MISKDIWEQMFSVFCRLRDDPVATRNHGSDELSLAAYIMEHAPLSTSQLFQDLMVLHELKGRRNGFFVEFGACDGRKLSNTFSLEKHFGWTGIVAEPSPVWHEGLFATRNCYISTKCVYPVSGESIVFNETTDPALSTVEAYTGSDFHAPARADGTRHTVETITLHDLLRAGSAPKHIDYLSIDTEGSELDILNTLDFTEFDVDIITVEHNYTSARTKLYDLLASKGYRRKYVGMSQFDDWYVKERRTAEA